jgi:hypothetical protein
MSAHPVGDDEQAEIVVGDVRVFVVSAHEPSISRRREMEMHAKSLERVR